jgi:DNA-binding winged helix-turn-helix (wHTH) protein
MAPLDIIFVGTNDTSRWVERFAEREPVGLTLNGGGDGASPDSPADPRYHSVSFQPPAPLPRDEVLAWVRDLLPVLLGGRADELTGPHGIRMRVSAREVCVGAELIRLTHHEFELLRMLLERPDEALTADELSLAIWGHETFGSRNYVESHVSRLRGKLSRAGAPGVITNLRRAGYVMRSERGRRGDASGYSSVTPRSESA